MCVNRTSRQFLSFFDIDFAVIIALFIQFFILVVTIAFFRWLFVIPPIVLCLITGLALKFSDKLVVRKMLFWINVCIQVFQLAVYVYWAISSV